MLRLALGVGLLLTAATALPAAAQDRVRDAWLVELRLRPDLRAREAWTPKDNAAVEAHWQRLQRLHASGRVLFAGRSLLQAAPGRDDPTAFGLVVLTARDEAEAQAVMNSDPAVAEGVMTARLHPFAVALPPRPEPRPVTQLRPPSPPQPRPQTQPQP